MTTEVKIEDVVALVQSNPEVKAALAGEFKTEITPESFKTYLDTDAGKLAAQSYVDSKNTKAIETWKNNNLQKHIDEALIKANPQDTPEQRQIRELTLKFEQQERATAHAKQEAYALQLIQSRQLPTGLVERFVGGTAEETLFNVNQFESEWKSSLQQAVEGATGNSGRRHLPDNPNASRGQEAPSRKLSEMNYMERQQLAVSNPQEFSRLEALEG